LNTSFFDPPPETPSYEIANALQGAAPLVADRHHCPGEVLLRRNTKEDLFGLFISYVKIHLTSVEPPATGKNET
jgi:hypothetical protein